ncbi:cell division protein FtsQ/DivIB [Falsirhodobacter sp. 20TX0035]|uniref:cell division protein FtsQ/DivIB n=1 Tax=Falsirhodobacter sp. 20TX0035 TaxID=3022019 RepID=UPI00233067EF|nr:cell division protein FtsQ/DivIB [Falsirhodobacter sp. 20TX0035]MDB6452068.1 cell division protein FtsQ/DivIB [Falsirhodobacter sp. 20TX0035]
MSRPPHRDPAPSRLAYRVQRMMLTPIYRRMLRFGLPLLALALVLLIALGSADRRAAIAASFAGLVESVQQRPEFMVNLFRVDGASPMLAEAIRRMMDLKLPQSSFDLDLTGLRDRVMQLDAVQDVDLRVEPGGVLAAHVTERVPVAVWRSGPNVELLDATGHRVMLVGERNDRSDLPLIAGRGANKAMPEAAALMVAAAPIMPRVRGFVRMGERRWDIVLDRGQRILLPVEQPVAALERILALDKAQDLLARDVTAIDFRLKERPVLRLSPHAVAERQAARGQD